jgi:hypothetical protein
MKKFLIALLFFIIITPTISFAVVSRTRPDRDYGYGSETDLGIFGWLGFIITVACIIFFFLEESEKDKKSSLPSLSPFTDKQKYDNAKAEEQGKLIYYS